MRLYTRIIILLVIITISIELTNAKKRNSGGSKPLKPSKPPGSTIKKLKKAALIGVGVYAGYKLTKAAAKFANVRFMSYSKCSKVCSSNFRSKPFLLLWLYYRFFEEFLFNIANLSCQKL